MLVLLMIVVQFVSIVLAGTVAFYFVGQSSPNKEKKKNNNK